MTVAQQKPLKLSQNGRWKLARDAIFSTRIKYNGGRSSPSVDVLLVWESKRCDDSLVLKE